MIFRLTILKQPLTITGVVLLLFYFGFSSSLMAQNNPGKLRKEILDSQAKEQNDLSGSRKVKRTAKPLAPFKPLAPIVDPLSNKNASVVYLKNAEYVFIDEELRPDMQRLIENVCFQHDNALLYCDSAYFYQKANSLDAFSNVRIVQADTLFVYGDFLYYDGNSKMARLRQNVRMENKTTTLTTDSLNYDRINNLAYYYTGGKIVDTENTLTSIWGQYSPNSNDAVFKTKVNMLNENFVMDADTLIYNTNTNISNIVGPSHIVYQDETNIYSSNGWYNTNTEQMMLLDRSKIIHKDGKTLIGDTIFYDKSIKFAESFVNVELIDSLQKSSLLANYIYYNEHTEMGLATDSALLMDWSSADTLWVHADTLRTFKDSIYDMALAYYNVRIFRNDLQGVSDSLVYLGRDSVMNMYGEPVLWAEENQLSGEFIQIFSQNNEVDQIHILTDAMAVQKEDSLYFNQLSGKDIIAYIDSGELRLVHVNGNAETIYFPKDDADSTLIGVNKTESSYVTMYFKNKKIDRMVMTTQTNGVMYPLEQLTGTDLFLKNYIWVDELRPKSKSDLMTRPAKKERIKIGTSSLMGISSPSNSNSGNKSGQNSRSVGAPNNATGDGRSSTNPNLKTGNVQTLNR